MSQLELALEAGVSARHISFVETGRAQASREMVLLLAESLDVPLRSRNDMLTAAGYAPTFGETELDDARMRTVRRALEFTLNLQEPYPSYVLDRHWNIILENHASAKLLNMLLDNRPPPEPPNALRLILDPKLLRPAIANWEAVTHVVLQRLRRQLAVPEPDPALLSLQKEAFAFPNVLETFKHQPMLDEVQLLVPLRFNLGARCLSWFTTIATFGTPQDITLEELRVETLYPANEDCEKFAQQELNGGG